MGFLYFIVSLKTTTIHNKKFTQKKTSL